jgi:hypothetical protein
MRRSLLPVLLFLSSIPTVCRSEVSPERFDRLSCAVVQILTDSETGTGVFIDKDGTLLTASHVLYDRRWILSDGNRIQIVLTPHNNIRYRQFRGVPVAGSSPTTPMMTVNWQNSIWRYCILAFLQTALSPFKGIYRS